MLVKFCVLETDGYYIMATLTNIHQHTELQTNNNAEAKTMTTTSQHTAVAIL